MNKSVSKIILLLTALTGLFLSFYRNAEPEKFKLITVLYNETNEERIAEYIICLEKNLAHDRIDQLHVIYDISKDDNKKIILNYLKNNNIPITYVSSRATYAFCFNLANELFPNSRIILSNADIYFNETLELLDDYDLTDKFLILTRWDIEQNGSLSLHSYSPKAEKSYSHDSWFFSTPLHFKDGNVLIGTPGCDGTIASQAQKNGFAILNPCFSIQGCHLHLTGLRNYEQKSAYPYIGLLPVPYDRITDPPHKNLLTVSEILQQRTKKTVSIPIQTDAPSIVPKPIQADAPSITSIPIQTDAPSIVPKPIQADAPSMTPIPIQTALPIITSDPIKNKPLHLCKKCKKRLKKNRNL